jgi:hypothetical protein
MSPKQKALEIYMKFYGIPLYIKTVKLCCHILVDEILTMRNEQGSFIVKETEREYWKEVKQEIDLIN